ncbi:MULTISPECIES: LysR family transcriptional regulator [unclassified Pseudomonas]|jgi:DNA-binding transcriptional LysR family regulator|uniref:LysR family transcriptional regulator n=1 Tax=unclassified Pseudomonas TaxID=196821 RepID=UPI000D018FC4|nr:MULTISPECIES: LysR family transcriptional regulator [unclassified Pseudomonas]MDR2319134.1 LysR family transcriptional regulator [Pseudomonas sp.]PRN07479.1 LysR family transcriptional regulator [Pseudomonas sp. LLC-1]PYG83072.1 LysR family transcriptional regulator [Pseudomonas sp. RV120224-01c]PYG86268.1 LysR family transcriptional regulator [Pseudomonas sp. RV120224-01b]
MEYELQDIRSFVKIAELGSFHEAAEALHLSQPALSRRIKKLEEGLGTALLERTTRRVGLTSVGRDFLPKARRLLDDFEDSILSIRELAERQTGQVTLACIPTAAFYFLPSVIRDYNERYPKIRIRLLDLSANDGLEAVLRGEADFGINMMSGQHPDIEFVSLVQEHFVLACRRDHALANRKAVTWTELAEHRLIGVGRLSGNRMLLDHALSGLNLRPKWFYEVQHLSTSLGMVEAGLGVSAMPSLAMPSADHPTLVSVPLTEPQVTRTLGLVYRRGASLSPAAEKFVSILLEQWPNR